MENSADSPPLQNNSVAELKPRTNKQVDDIDTKLKKLLGRIKNTSGVRFSASKRVKFNYGMAQLTVVVLSLWSITISTALTFHTITIFAYPEQIVQLVGILLPVGIVVFSLIENGETYLRANLLEMNARQLRELSDKLYADIARNKGDRNSSLIVFEETSKNYNDILERSPINHDDIDHWTKKYIRDRENVALFSTEWNTYVLFSLAIWARRQFKRVIFFSFWIGPAALFKF